MKEPREPTPQELETYKRMLSSEGLQDLQRRITPVQVYGRTPVREQQTVLPAEARPLEPPRKTLNVKLSDVPGMWFSLAPVYYICKVPFSWPQEFINSDLGGSDISIFAYHTEFPIIPDIPEWERTIEIVELLTWQRFVQFMTEVSMLCKNKVEEGLGRLATVSLYPLVVPDRRHQSYFTLNVFAPVFGSQRLIPFVDGMGLVRFRWIKGIPRDPAEAIFKTGEKL